MDRQRHSPLLARVALSVIPVTLAATLGGYATAVSLQSWYQALVKPSFNPPDWVFGPVWTVLYALMALAVFRVATHAQEQAGKPTALAFYFAQLVLNAVWPAAFFALRSPLGGLIVIIPLLSLVVATMVQFYRLDRPAGLMFVPYALWVSFAVLLNAAVWYLNR